MEDENLLDLLQEIATGRYPEPDESSRSLAILFRCSVLFWYGDKRKYVLHLLTLWGRGQAFVSYGCRSLCCHYKFKISVIHAPVGNSDRRTDGNFSS
jgi:hypothetical protein